MIRAFSLLNHVKPIARSYSPSFLIRNLSTSSRETVDYAIKDGVAVVKFDNKKEKMNSLGEKVSLEIKEITNEIFNNPSVTSVVLISGKLDNFIVGADIRMLDKIKSAAEGEKMSKDAQDMMNLLARSNKPVVAAIMGSCLGGGLEVALACNYRIAVNDKKTQLGLPEVMLGILPGAGGTQRLPSLVDIQTSLPMMLTGASKRAPQAKKMGLVDQVIEPLGPGLMPGPERTLEYLEEVAVQAAKDLASGKLKPNRNRPFMEKLLRRAMKYNFVSNVIFDKAKAQVMKQTNGLYPAPLKIIEVVKAGVQKGTDAGFAAEAKGFGQLIFTPHSRALIGLFHGRTQCLKNRFGKPSKVPENVAVLGAGLMGAGIATVSLDNAGHNVIMKDANVNGLVRGEQQLRKVLDGKVKRKRMAPTDRDKLMSKLQSQLDYTGFENADIVIEAVIEDLKIKHRVVKEVEEIIRPDCIFATNTSAISIASIAEASKRPENIIGMHYFSPVEKMPLLEVVVTDKTSNEAKSRAVAVGLKQGKVVITVKDAPAFYTTRILSFLMAEVIQQIQEGVEITKMDKLTKSMGFPVGLVTLMDEVGFDTAMHITAYLQPIFGQRLSDTDAKAGKEMVEAGFCGRKSGKGWFLYEDGPKAKGPRPVNQKALEIIKKFSIKPNRTYTDEELQMRMMTRFTNEALLCLQEGILANPVEGDIGAVFGLGYPPFHGGPFRYIDEFGAGNFLKWMEKFESEFGPKFTPCELLKQHARDSSKKFHPRS